MDDVRDLGVVVPNRSSLATDVRLRGLPDEDGGADPPEGCLRHGEELVEGPLPLLPPKGFIA